MEKSFNYKKIVNWFLGFDGEILNLISHPFYDLKLVAFFLKKNFEEEHKVLYITENEEYVRRQFVKYGLEFEKFIKFSTPFSSIDSKGKISLVIFDDISGISSIEDSAIIPLLRNVQCKKKMILSMKELVKYNKIHVMNEKLDFFKEPRSVHTKMDLNSDMPHVVFQFIEWFMLNKTKVILLTKDNFSSKSIYNYMKKYVSLSPKLNNLFIYSDYDSFQEFYRSDKLESYIYITSKDFLNEIQELFYKDKKLMEEFNILVFFASDKVFNYKKLLYLCGMYNFLKNCKNEVIFVSNDENMEIITAKRISRNYNKKIWEWGLRKY